LKVFHVLYGIFPKLNDEKVNDVTGDERNLIINLLEIIEEDGEE